MTDKPDKSTNFWEEIKRRKVFGVIIIYATISAGIIGLISDVYEPLGLPVWTPTMVIIILGIGFPLVVIFAWIFDITSKGITKTEPMKPDDQSRDLRSIIDKVSVPEKSIIVLPFENISSDPEQEYFSDGLTEELISHLSFIKDLLVISRSSSMIFKGKKIAIQEIAEKVNVRYVLEGSVRKSKNRLRITAQLIDARNDSHLWAESYDGNLDDIFDIQEDVSKNISNSLKLHLSPAEKIHLSQRQIENVDAYEYYHRARKEMSTYTEEAFLRSLDNINKALDTIGQNALLYAAIAEINFGFAHIGVENPELYMKNIESAVEKIRELDPDSEFIYLWTGLALFKKPGQLNEAMKNLKFALDINPNQPSILVYFCFLMMEMGKNEMAKPYLKKLLEIDPLNGIPYLLTGFYYTMAGEFSKAVGFYKKAIEIDDVNPDFHFFYAHGLALCNDKTGAIQAISDNRGRFSGNSFFWLTDFIRIALIGDTSKVNEVVHEGLLNTAKFDESYSWVMSECYSLLDMKKEALHWLDNAVNRGFLNYKFLIHLDPFLENIRNEKGFKRIMKKAKENLQKMEI